jgi:hypothetical protein
MKYIAYALLVIALVSFALTAGAQAVRVFTSEQVGTNPVDGYCLTTNGATSTWAPCATGGSGTPGGGDGQIQFNNAGSFGGTSSPSVTSINATSTTATSTLPNIITQAVKSLTSAGLQFFSNAGTLIADFGAGGGSNATFFGGVNIDGQTRIATNLTGPLRADNGVISTTTSSAASSNWTLVPGGLRTSTTTDFAQAAYFAATSTTGTSTFAGRVGVGTTSPTNGLLEIANSATVSGLYVTQSGTLASEQAGINLRVNSDLAATTRYGQHIYTNVLHTSGRLFQITDDNASSTLSSTLHVQSDGTPVNAAAFIDINSNGRGSYVDKDVTDVNNTTAASQIDHRSIVTNGGTITKTGAALSINSNVTETSGTITDSAQVLDINQDHADATGNVVDIASAGTGNALSVITSGTLAASRRALNVQTTSDLSVSNTDAALIYSNVANTGADNYLLRVWEDNPASTMSGAMMINQDGSGKGIFLDVDGSGRAIDIDQDGNSASRITGIHVNVANAGAGGANAAVFEAGNVGIATTSPVRPLSVAGSSIFTGELAMDGSLANIALGNNYLSGDGGDEGIFVEDTGDVGIGTTEPSSRLHIAHATNASMRFEKTGVNAGTFQIYNDGFANIIGPGSSPQRRFAFYDQMGAANGGNVGTPPFTNFNDTNTGIYFPSNTDTVALVTGGIARLNIANGNIGIGGGTTTPSALLTVNGDMRLTGRFADSSSSTGSVGSVLTATANGTAWVATSSLGITGGGAAASGTINVGNAGELAYYAATGTDLSATSSLAIRQISGVWTFLVSLAQTVFSGSVQFLAQIFDSTGSAGANGQALTSTGTSTAWAFPMQSYRSFVEYFDDFMEETSNAGDATWGEDINGTGAACTATAIGTTFTNRPGMSRCTTGTTITGRAGLVTSLNSIALGQGTTTFETAVQITDLSVLAQRYVLQAGFFDTNGTTTTDGAYLAYDEGGNSAFLPASANWQCVTASNNVRSTSTSAIAVTAGAVHRLTTVVDAAGTSVSFFVNGTLACTLATNIPTGTVRATSHGFQALKALGTTGRTFDVDYNYARVEFTTPR